ncbi:MAG: 16S rRNA (cytosine(1402)-N(4))-methyltransferase, partial [Pseudomonadota bacterium]
MSAQHIQVFPSEVLEFLNCKDDGVYVDATLGNGEHARAILKRYPNIKMLVGIDQDEDALARAEKNIEPFFPAARVLHGNFRDLKTILKRVGIHSIDGILFDLGVSTPQLKDPSRGFSFSLEGTLDMRMDRSTPLQAKDLVAALSVQELT